MPDSPKPTNAAKAIAKRYGLTADERAKLTGRTLGQLADQAQRLVDRRTDDTVTVAGADYDGGGTLVRSDTRTRAAFASVADKYVAQIDATEDEDLTPRQRRIAARLEAIRGDA